MKVLLINGSPNQNGCTYTALNEIAVQLEKEGVQSEILYLGANAINDCMACGYCDDNGCCVVNDLVNEVAQKLDQYDGFIFGSPVYYAAPASRLTAFLDRLFFILHFYLLLYLVGMIQRRLMFLSVWYHKIVQG